MSPDLAVALLLVGLWFLGVWLNERHEQREAERFDDHS
jgi:hypothetical protein